MMLRREFITVFGGGAVAAWPLASRAQQTGMPVVAWFLHTTAVSAANFSGFRQALGDAGFVDGRNVAIQFVFADNRLDRLPALAAELVRRRVAVIVTNNTTTPPAKAATSTIPIVFVSGGDAVGAGLVTNLNRPGGNVTGVSWIADTLNPKRFELMHELVPKAATIAVLWDPNVSGLPEIEAAAGTLDRNIFVIEAAAEKDFDDAFAEMTRARVGALFVGNGGFYFSNHRQLVALAARHALPASYHRREFVEVGGLMRYAASIADANRRAGSYVGRILKGEKPGDLPVELPTRYELVFNLATAKALKIDIPAKLLALADEVIE
jgi:putative ABC transport system substrate-binding protein